MSIDRVIENDRLRVKVKDDGAELCSIYDKKEKREIIWQAPGAPFICLEPWWGRCDNYGFDGTIEEKPGIIAIEPGKSFEAKYTILIG